MKDILLLILIGIAAAFYGIHSGRAKADRLRDLPSTISRMRIRDWFILAVIICGIAVISSTLMKNNRAAKIDSLREQFLLPADIEFLDFRTRGASNDRISIRAAVKFTPQQWQDYLTKLYDPSLWQPAPLRLAAPIPIPFKKEGFHWKGDIIDGDYAANARVWNELPKPLEYETGLRTLREYPRLYHYWWNEGEAKPKAGRVMCYIFHRDHTGQDVDLPQRSYLNYKVSACADLTKRDAVNTYVLGILDFDKKTLRMVIE